MTTTEQKAHFDTFGFLFMRELFSPKDMTGITREADDVLSEDRQGQPVPDEGQTVVKIVERRALLTQLAEDDRIYNIGVDSFLNHSNFDVANVPAEHRRVIGHRHVPGIRVFSVVSGDGGKGHGAVSGGAGNWAYGVH